MRREKGNRTIEVFGQRTNGYRVKMLNEKDGTCKTKDNGRLGKTLMDPFLAI